MLFKTSLASSVEQSCTIWYNAAALHEGASRSIEVSRNKNGRSSLKHQNLERRNQPLTKQNANLPFSAPGMLSSSSEDAYFLQELHLHVRAGRAEPHTTIHGEHENQHGSKDRDWARSLRQSIARVPWQFSQTICCSSERASARLLPRPSQVRASDCVSV